MFKRLRKWIHRNNPEWLEEHGYVEKVDYFVIEVPTKADKIFSKEEVEASIERASAGTSVIQGNTCSVARSMGLGYSH